MDRSCVVDWYEVLGVSAHADAAQIQAAYRHLAKRHHPDAGGDGEMFKHIAEAYRILSDPTSRAVHDAERVAGDARYDTADKQPTEPMRPASEWAGDRTYPNSIPRVVRSRGYRRVGVARSYLLRAWVGGAAAIGVVWRRSIDFRVGANDALVAHGAGVDSAGLREHLITWGVSAWLFAAGVCAALARIDRERRRWWIEVVAVAAGVAAAVHTPYPAVAAVGGAVLLRASTRREAYVEYR